MFYWFIQIQIWSYKISHSRLKEKMLVLFFLNHMKPYKTKYWRVLCNNKIILIIIINDTFSEKGRLVSLWISNVEHMMALCHFMWCVCLAHCEISLRHFTCSWSHCSNMLACTELMTEGPTSNKPCEFVQMVHVNGKASAFTIYLCANQKKKQSITGNQTHPFTPVCANRW